MKLAVVVSTSTGAGSRFGVRLPFAALDNMNAAFGATYCREESVGNTRKVKRDSFRNVRESDFAWVDEGSGVGNLFPKCVPKFDDCMSIGCGSLFDLFNFIIEDVKPCIEACDALLKGRERAVR